MPKPSPLWGSLRWVQPRKIAGWAYAPQRPGEHLRIEIRLDGALVAVACADAPYEQLARSGICAADHGFVAETEALLPVDGPARIEATAVGAGGERLRLYLPGDKPGDDRGPGRLLRLTPVDRQARPVFVLGAARSGTSAVGRALRRSGRFKGHGEGHLLPLLGKLRQTVRAHYDGEGRAAAAGAFTMLASVPEAVIEEGLRALFARLARAQFPDGGWMEKTPGAEMIALAPTLAQIWPEATFLFLARRGIENVQSRRRKFPDRSFEQHCRGWAEAMQAWLGVRTGLAGRSLEIEQLDLARAPQAVAARIAARLGLDEPEAGRLAQSLAGERPQQTAMPLGAVAEPAALDWTDDERAQFAAICGDAMRAFGYLEDGGYRAEATAAAGIGHEQAGLLTAP